MSNPAAPVGIEIVIFAQLDYMSHLIKEETRRIAAGNGTADKRAAYRAEYVEYRGALSYQTVTKYDAYKRYEEEIKNA